MHLDWKFRYSKFATAIEWKMLYSFYHKTKEMKGPAESRRKKKMVEKVIEITKEMCRSDSMTTTWKRLHNG